MPQAWRNASCLSPTPSTPLPTPLPASIGCCPLHLSRLHVGNSVVAVAVAVVAVDNCTFGWLAAFCSHFAAIEIVYRLTGNCDLCKLQLDTFATAKCGMNEDVDFAGDFLRIISSVVCCFDSACCCCCCCCYCCCYAWPLVCLLTWKIRRDSRCWGSRHSTQHTPHTNLATNWIVFVSINIFIGKLFAHPTKKKKKKNYTANRNQNRS